MVLAKINLLAVLGAALASMVLGKLWYSPNSHGKLWAKLSKLSKADMKKLKKTEKKSAMWGFFANLVTAYVLGLLLTFTGDLTVWGGVSTAFLVWLGFIAMPMLGMVLWEGKPFKLYLLKVKYQLLSLAIMGAILGYWI